jgi:hypothetical protein
MLFKRIIERPNKKVSNILLFTSSFTFIFLVPFFPRSLDAYLNDILFSVVFFSGIYALDYIRKEIVFIAIIAFITQWIASFLHIEMMQFFSELTNVVFIQVIIIRLIIQIAKSKVVNTNVIFESINGYLLLGILFTAWVSILKIYVPDAFNGLDHSTSTVQDVLYFTFVTMTTLGYGEITPQVPMAKSLSILISTSGQLYIAILIALLVGKFAGNQQNS